MIALSGSILNDAEITAHFRESIHATTLVEKVIHLFRGHLFLLHDKRNYGRVEVAGARAHDEPL